MDREQIEKAAGEYSGSVLGFKDNPVVMAKHKAFMDGADWRINAVWHDANEDHQRVGEPMLVEFHDFGMEGNSYDVVEDLRGYRNGIYAELIRWAYVSDLLPERKEETK